MLLSSNTQGENITHNPHYESNKRWRLNNPNYSRNLIKKAKNFLFSKLGHKCVICGKSNHQIVFHEIHGKPHKTLTYNQAVKRWQDFIPLCRNCHHALHRYIRYKEEMDKLSMEFLSKGLNKAEAS